MKDPAFINQKVVKGQKAREKVVNSLVHLLSHQSNWKPSPTTWSINECLDHLLVSDRLYFKAFRSVIEGSYQISFWEKYSPLSKFWGRAMIKQLQEEVGRKMKSPKNMRPQSSDKPADFVHTYLDNLNIFLELIGDCRSVDIDQVIITSPALRFVTYSLRDAIEFLINHEHRHINQAIRVTTLNNFPSP